MTISKKFTNFRYQNNKIEQWSSHPKKNKHSMPQSNGMSSSLVLNLISMLSQVWDGSLLTDQTALIFDAKKRNPKRYVVPCVVQNLLVFSLKMNCLDESCLRSEPGCTKIWKEIGIQEKILNYKQQDSPLVQKYL